jgi:hypothetical protein
MNATGIRHDPFTRLGVEAVSYPTVSGTHERRFLSANNYRLRNQPLSRIPLLSIEQSLGHSATGHLLQFVSYLRDDLFRIV